MDSSISWLDMVAVGLMLVLGIFGAVRGAVRTVVGLLAGMAGVVMASRYGADLNAKTWPGIADMENAEAVGVGFGVCGPQWRRHGRPFRGQWIHHHAGHGRLVKF